MVGLAGCRAVIRQARNGPAGLRRQLSLIASPPFPATWPRQIVPVGSGFTQRLVMARVQAIGGPGTAREPT